MSHSPRILLTLLISFSFTFGCTNIEVPRLSDDLTDVTDHDTNSPDNDSNSTDSGNTTPPQEPILEGPNANVVFVSAEAGNDNNDGLTSEEPKKSITEGINLAKKKNLSYVVVATGDYQESITLQEGIHLLGGYDPDTWTPPSESTSTIKSDGTLTTDTEYKTIIAKNIDTETIFNGFTVYGQNADSASNSGVSTFALWSLNSNLLVQDSHFIAGKASDGAHGKDALQTTAADCSDVENTGGEGGEADNTDPCSDNNALPQAPPGKPGTTGDGTGPDNAQTPQKNGGTHICGQAKPSIDGAIGANGTDGGPGENSTPITSNSLGMFSLTDNTWYPPQAEPPTKGKNGGGGQGGGAGGNLNDNILPGGPFKGGIGGAGGKGGCGGHPGENGQAGGSSFGIAVLSGNASFENIHITLGAGGNGGDFGQPGEGSEGNYGINGLPGQSDGPNRDAGRGGWGGPGGNGGPGGKAIGGNGGHAIGLAFTNEATIEEISPITYTENSGEAGTQGTDGWDTSGLNITRNGIVEDTQEFPHSNN